MKIKTTRRKQDPCLPPPLAPADYCSKLRKGFTRLRNALQQRYEQAFPEERDQVRHAVASAEAAAWATPFPALFLSALIHLKIAEVFPQIVVNSASSFQS